MSAIEDRLREAFRADAETIGPQAIRPETIRPETIGSEAARPALARGIAAGLRAGRAGRGSGSRRFGSRQIVIPLAAAAAVAVIALAAALASARTGPGEADGGPAIAPVSGAVQAAPRYFVGMVRSGLAVYNAETGRRTSLIRPPRSGLSFDGVAATGDSRSFIVAAARQQGGCYTLLYRLALTAGGGRASLTPLAVPRVDGALMSPSTSLAASASGQVIGYSASGCGGGHGWADVIWLASGQARRWPLSSEGLFSLTMSPDGRTLDFDYSSVYGGDGTIRALRTDAAAGPMTQRARVVLAASSGVDGTGTIALVDGGRILLACREVQRDAVLASYSAATGRELAVLHTWPHVDTSPCTVSATPSGDYVLVTNVAGRGIGTRIDLATGRTRLVPGGGPGGIAPPAGVAW